MLLQTLRLGNVAFTASFAGWTAAGTAQLEIPESTAWSPSSWAWLPDSRVVVERGGVRLEAYGDTTHGWIWVDRAWVGPFVRENVVGPLADALDLRWLFLLATGLDDEVLTEESIEGHARTEVLEWSELLPSGVAADAAIHLRGTLADGAIRQLSVTAGTVALALAPTTTPVEVPEDLPRGDLAALPVPASILRSKVHARRQLRNVSD